MNRSVRANLRRSSRIWLPAVVVVLGVCVAGAVAASGQSQRSRVVSTPAPTSSAFVYERPASQKNVVFIGDSYTAGVGASNADDRFASIVATAEHWNARNFGRGGTGYVTSSDVTGCGRDYCPTYDQMLAAVKRAAPQIVVVSGGRNDLGRTDAALTKGIPKFFRDLHSAAPHAIVYVTSPIWDDDATPARIDYIGGLVKAAAKQTGATYLDIGEPLEGHPEYIIADGVHPNDKGHAAIAAAVIAALRRTK